MDDELRQQIRREYFLTKLLRSGLIVVLLGGFSSVFIWPLLPFQQTFSFPLFLIGLILLTYLYANHQTQKMMKMIDDVLAGKLDASELFGDSQDNISLGGFFGNPEMARALNELFDNIGKDGELAKSVDWKGGEVYKTRGKDPRGPAAGKGADTFGDIVTRVDAMMPRPEHEGIEGPLTKTEKMVEEANEIAAEKALKEWEAAEAADPELIEAGVDKLGDLVASGHFKGPENKP